jgi:hypothetical protein
LNVNAIGMSPQTVPHALKRAGSGGQPRTPWPRNKVTNVAPILQLSPSFIGDFFVAWWQREAHTALAPQVDHSAAVQFVAAGEVVKYLNRTDAVSDEDDQFVPIVHWRLAEKLARMADGSTDLECKFNAGYPPLARLHLV